MIELRHQKISASLAFLFSVLMSSSSVAGPVPVAPGSDSAPCGVIEKFSGEAFLLDSSRAHLDEVREKAPVACDGWISTSDAWVEVRHRNGHLVRISRNSFVQFQNGDSDFSVLRGVLYSQVSGSPKPQVIITPNAKAVLQSGTSILIYSPEKESTQWLILEKEGVLENRFQEGARTVVHQGESSILDVAHSKVLPQEPKAITVASLRPLLHDLAVDSERLNQSVRVALERQRRIFPAEKVSDDTESRKHQTIERSPAQNEKKSVGNYRRHPVDGKSPSIRRAFSRHVLEGTDGIGIDSSSIVEGDSVSESQRDRDRKKLLNELSRIPASQ